MEQPVNDIRFKRTGQEIIQLLDQNPTLLADYDTLRFLWHRAIYLDTDDLFKYLCQHNCKDFIVRNTKAADPLKEHYALLLSTTLMACLYYNKYRHRAKWLMLNGLSDLEYSNSYGDTALDWAARIGDCELVTMLLERGVQCNTRGYQHNTSLISAVLRGHLEVAQMLMNYGANPNLLNHRNCAARDYALGPLRSMFDRQQVAPLRYLCTRYVRGHRQHFNSEQLSTLPFDLQECLIDLMR